MYVACPDQAQPYDESRGDISLGHFQRQQVSFESGTWMVCTEGHVFQNQEYQGGRVYEVGCPKCMDGPEAV